MAWSQSGNIRGASGVPGASGPPGATGPQGPQGPTGATGASGGTGGTGGPGTTSWNDITDKPGAILNYKGTWNVSTNTPTLSDSTGSGGDVYRVSVGGSRNLGSGTISWEVGDYAIWSPVTSSWEKADTTDAVSSVAGRTGAVTLTSADLGASGSASSSTFLRGDNTWATPTAITRSVSTITSPTTIGSAANTDYVVFANVNNTGDLLFSSVTALLNGNGTNNSTTITDSSTVASNWTAVTNAKLTTGTKKFGSAAIAFDGSSDTYIRATAASSNFAFGTSDFTIEFWVYFNTVSGTQVLYDSRPLTTQGLYPVIRLETGSIIEFYINATARITSSAVSANTWYHVAVCRSGTSTRMFLNGTQAGSTYTDSNNYINATNRPIMGADGFGPSGNRFNGVLDDVRVTKAARYTAGFTAPTNEFPSVAGTLATVTLPTAVSSTNLITVKNINTSTSLTVDTTSSQTIDGQSTATISVGSTARYISDGSNWRTV